MSFKIHYLIGIQISLPESEFAMDSICMLVLSKHSAMQVLFKSFLPFFPCVSCKTGSMFQFPAFQQPNCFEHPLSSYSTGHLKPPLQALAPDTGIWQVSDIENANCVIRRKMTSILQF